MTDGPTGTCGGKRRKSRYSRKRHTRRRQHQRGAGYFPAFNGDSVGGMPVFQGTNVSMPAGAKRGGGASYGFSGERIGGMAGFTAYPTRSSVAGTLGPVSAMGGKRRKSRRHSRSRSRKH